MFVFNLSDGSSHCYPNVDKAYEAYLALWLTEGDIKYYKECCGYNLKDVTSSETKKSIFRNVFELVVYSFELEKPNGIWG